MTDEEAAAKTVSALRNFAAAHAGHDVKFGDLLTELRGRNLNLLIVLFALPNAIIPGLSFFLGIPVLFLAGQIALGRRDVWLPASVTRRTLTAPLFRRATQAAGSFLNFTEKRTRKRWVRLADDRAERPLALLMALFTVFLMMPVPFGNALPALGISLIAIGLMERDGKATALGVVTGVAGMAYIIAALTVGIEVIKRIL